MTLILYSFISEKDHQALLRENLHQFSFDFQQKIAGFMFWEDAQLSLLGRLLLLKGIQKMGKTKCPPIGFNGYKKPYFKDNSLEFNISHSKELVVCAISPIGSLGIDVEYLSAINLDAFKSIMTAKEWQNINDSGDAQETFYHYWTKKEAVIKAIGKGLSIPLKSFEVILDQTSVKGSIYYLKEIEISSKYSCSLSSSKQTDLHNINLIKYIINKGVLETAPKPFFYER